MVMFFPAKDISAADPDSAGRFNCCAAAASGHVTVPPKTAMKSRRLMDSPCRDFRPVEASTIWAGLSAATCPSGQKLYIRQSRCTISCLRILMAELRGISGRSTIGPDATTALARLARPVGARVVRSVVIIAAIAALNFVIVHLAPGDVADVRAGGRGLGRRGRGTRCAFRRDHCGDCCA